MASYKSLIVLAVALFAVAFAAEEARDKRGVVYGGYGAVPYSAGVHSAVPYSAGVHSAYPYSAVHSAYPSYSAGYSAYPYSAGYGLGYSGYNGYSGYSGYPYGAVSYVH